MGSILKKRAKLIGGNKLKKIEDLLRISKNLKNQKVRHEHKWRQVALRYHPPRNFSYRGWVSLGAQEEKDLHYGYTIIEYECECGRTKEKKKSGKIEFNSCLKCPLLKDRTEDLSSKSKELIQDSKRLIKESKKTTKDFVSKYKIMKDLLREIIKLSGENDEIIKNLVKERGIEL